MALGIRIITHHPFHTVNHGNPCATIGVVIHDRQLIFGQTIFQEHHAFIGVSGVLAVRITTHQFGEVIEGIARVLRIAVGAINAEEALKRAVIGAMLVRPRI